MLAQSDRAPDDWDGFNGKGEGHVKIGQNGCRLRRGIEVKEFWHMHPRYQYIQRRELEQGGFLVFHVAIEESRV